jgi:beta-glucosidase
MHNDILENAAVGLPRPYVVEPCGERSNFWENYENDIGLASDIGSNALRLSLEWSRIMPAPNYIDEAAVQRYHEIFDAMKR